MEYTEDQIQQVWNKARSKPNSGDATFGDICQVEIKFLQYDKETEFGWKIFSSRPNTTEFNIHFLQPVHWQNCERNFDNTPKCLES